MTDIPRYTRMPEFLDLTIAEDRKMLSSKRMWRSFVSSDSNNIYPVCDGDWQLTNDYNGAPYPSGLKQARLRHKWDRQDISDMSSLYVDDYIVAVPTDLPAGYTATALKYETQMLAKFTGVGANDRTPAAPSLIAPPGHHYGTGAGPIGAFIRTPAALEVYPWMPENVGNACWPWRDYMGNEVAGNYSGWPGPGIAQGNMATQGWTAGMRYIKFTFDTTAIGVALRVQVRRDATPIEADRLVAGTVVCYNSGSIGAGVYDSGFIYHGDPGVDMYSPTLGTRWNFEVAVERDDGMGGWVPVTTSWLDVHAADMSHIDWHFYAGPRLDIPLPWNVSTDSYMVPGGIVAGAITGY